MSPRCRVCLVVFLSFSAVFSPLSVCIPRFEWSYCEKHIADLSYFILHGIIQAQLQLERLVISPFNDLTSAQCSLIGLMSWVCHWRVACSFVSLMRSPLPGLVKFESKLKVWNQVNRQVFFFEMTNLRGIVLQEFSHIYSPGLWIIFPCSVEMLNKHVTDFLSSPWDYLKDITIAQGRWFVLIVSWSLFQFPDPWPPKPRWASLGWGIWETQWPRTWSSMATLWLLQMSSLSPAKSCRNWVHRWECFKHACIMYK